MTEQAWEHKAQERLMNIVTRARNKQPYKHLLQPLAKALNKAPNIKQAVQESLRHIEGKGK